MILAKTFFCIHPAAAFGGIVLTVAVYLWFRGGFPTR